MRPWWNILLLALYASRTRGHVIRLAVAVTAVAVVASLVQALTGGGGGVAAAAGSVMFVLVIMAPIAITARIVQHPVVNLETILGAVCAYLLIGLLFAGLYRAADAMSTEPFFGQTATPSPVQYLYFSYITLTTVGFGDLTVATDGGRVMVSFEALIGQVFLVTIVAGLIGSYGQQRPKVRAHRDAADPDS
ncbi:MAG: potassium channel family protein [Actinomycetota bacterium]|nr:potassium channel family protein [Actinomycetota bacterium]